MDQLRPDGTRVMRNVDRLLASRGTSFANSFVSYALCCPSRATFLTGQYAHNHGVLSNTRPLGGYGKLDHANTLPVWLQSAGYHTAHIGKYLNGYGYVDTNPADTVPACKEIPQGWNEWYGGVGGSTYRYHDYVVNENGNLMAFGTPAVLPPTCPQSIQPRIYQTDLYVQKAIEFIERRAVSDDAKPFFLSLSFLAPHSDNVSYLGGPEPAPRHAGLFDETPLPESPSFNEAGMADKPSFVRARPELSPKNIQLITHRFRKRMESLLAVDEGVESMIAALASNGLLDNTVVLFTSDNGWMQGEHRIVQGKAFFYEEAIRVPLIISGPGVPRNQVITELVSNVDWAPTILETAQADAGLMMDGRSMMPLVTGDPTSWRSTILLETILEVGGKKKILGQGVRSADHVYSVYSTREEELYDLQNDPYELESQHDDPDFANIRADLRLLRALFGRCAGDSCWR